MAPPCLFHSLTGIPCPTCGATRAVVALSRLDLAGAAAFNPLATIAVIAFVLGGLTAGFAAMVGRPLREPSPWPPGLRLALLVAISGNWAWLILHAH